LDFNYIGVAGQRQSSSFHNESSSPLCIACSLPSGGLRNSWLPYPEQST
jgi:hypothetical protein